MKTRYVMLASQRLYLVFSQSSAELTRIISMVQEVEERLRAFRPVPMEHLLLPEDDARSGAKDSRVSPEGLPSHVSPNTNSRRNMLGLGANGCSEDALMLRPLKKTLVLSWVGGLQTKNMTLHHASALLFRGLGCLQRAKAACLKQGHKEARILDGRFSKG